jgi:hypothetical protein
MRRTFYRKGLLAAACIIVIASLLALAWHSARSNASAPQTYHNDTYGFSLQLPQGFTVTEVPSANSPTPNAPVDIIEFDNAARNIQLTIVLAPDLPAPLTVESLLPNYPSLADATVEPFPLSPSVTGLSIADDPAHQGQITNVWFARGQYLYMFTASDGGFGDLLPIAQSIQLF